jgi:tRNA(Ile2) C34 agmatinyltransferase TiaS
MDNILNFELSDERKQDYLKIVENIKRKENELDSLKRQRLAYCKRIKAEICDVCGGTMKYQGKCSSCCGKSSVWSCECGNSTISVSPMEINRGSI